MARPTRVALTLLLLATLARGLLFVVAIPAWQSPDEPSHYLYVAAIAHGDLRPPRLGFSPTPALTASVASVGYEAFERRTALRPLSPALARLYPSDTSGLPDRPITAPMNPPGYYLLQAPLYAIPGLDTANDRLYAMRLGSVVLGAALVALTFLLLREVVDDDRIALTGAAVTMLIPTVGQASAILNPDILLGVGGAALALACLRVRRLGLTPLRVAGLVVAFVLLSSAKAIGLLAAALIVGSLLVLPPVVRRVGHPVVVTGAAFVVGTVVIVLLAYREFQEPVTTEGLRFMTSYLWQFYLPPLPFMQRVFPSTILTEPVPAWPILVKTGIGYLGLISVQLPRAVYLLGMASSVIAVGVSAITLVRRRHALDADRPVIALGCVLTVVLFLIGLHASEAVLFLQAGPAGQLIQGRYLLPVLPLGILFAALGLDALGRRGRALAMGSLLVVWTIVVAAAVDSTLQFYAAT